jgi:thiol-disulfide isomerase/thioredoxin
MWSGRLEIQPGLFLPFSFEKNSKKDNGFLIVNDAESIKMDIQFETKDSLILVFPNFNSKLFLSIKNNKTLLGYWLNYNKGSDYKIPCKIIYNTDKKKAETPYIFNNSTLAEKWEVYFDDGNGLNYPALGLFHQNNFGNVTGTFATETGDYRYLNGLLFNDSLRLSCFDGAHAYLFLGKLLDSTTIEGAFYSGKHWSTSWIGKANKDFKLQDPDAITFAIDSSIFNFKSYYLDSSIFNYPSTTFNNEVTIIQIMGTWCPNCMDESLYLQQLYNKYNDKGLNIIGVAYEMGDSFTNYKENIVRFKNKNNIEYLITIGGKASKDLASEQFYQLNKISAFPTSIILDKKGKVKSIHTGFYGPSTGIYYENYTNEIENLIIDLLSE